MHLECRQYSPTWRISCASTHEESMSMFMYMHTLNTHTEALSGLIILCVNTTNMEQNGISVNV